MTRLRTALLAASFVPAFAVLTVTGLLWLLLELTEPDDASP